MEVMFLNKELQTYAVLIIDGVKDSDRRSHRT